MVGGISGLPAITGIGKLTVSEYFRDLVIIKAFSKKLYLAHASAILH